MKKIRLKWKRKRKIIINNFNRVEFEYDNNYYDKK